MKSRQEPTVNRPAPAGLNDLPPCSGRVLLSETKAL